MAYCTTFSVLTVKRGQQFERLWVNFPGVSQQLFKQAEAELEIKLERELNVKSLSVLWCSGKTGLSVSLAGNWGKNEKDRIVEQTCAIVATFDLIDENDTNRITDEVLGEFYWNDWNWETNFSLDDGDQCQLENIGLSIAAEHKEDDIAVQLELMKDFMSNVGTQLGLIKERITDELLDTYNDEERKTRDEFLERIEMTGLRCNQDGLLTCSFYGDGLFGDLDICVLLNTDRSIQSIFLH